MLLLLVTLGFLIYSNTLEAPFLLDDNKAIQENPHIRITRLTFKEIGKAGFNKKRPIAHISFALNYYFDQYNLMGYHVVNIIIHILNGILLYFFTKTTLIIMGSGMWDVRQSSKDEGRRTSNNQHPVTGSQSLNPSFIAFFTALVWLVHPIQTQSVTYIVQRMNSMAAMFFVLSFLLYIKGRLVQEQRSNDPQQEKELRLKDQSSKGKSPRGKKTKLNAKIKKRKSKSSKHKVESKKLNLISVPRFHYLWFAGSALAWILALGCKQTTATLPFFIFLYEWYFLQGLSRDWLNRHLRYFLGILILFGLIAFIYFGLNPLERILSLTDYAHHEFTFVERVLTQFRVVVYYLSLLFYPHPSRLNLDYDFALSHSLINPITTLLSLVAIGGLIALACCLAKNKRLISFCIIWFFGNLVIESSIIPLAIIFEHRTYLPSMLVCLITVILMYRYIKPELLRVAMLCAVVLVFSVWTFERNSVWSDGVTLWKDCVEKSPKKARPRANLAFALDGQGRTEEAIKQNFVALQIKPDFEEAHYNLGIVLEKQGRIDEAIEHYLEALRIRPGYVKAQNNLGIALEKQGRIDEAIEHYLNALRIRPDYAEAHYNLGIALEKQGRIDEAIEHFLEALRIRSAFEEAHYNLGIVLEKQGRIDEAIKHFLEALRIRPDFEEAQNNLGVVLGKQGRIDEAIKHFLEALRIRPDYAEAHNNLGIALFHKGNIEGAIDHFREALRIEPNYVGANYNLKRALMVQQQDQ